MCNGSQRLDDIVHRIEEDKIAALQLYTATNPVTPEEIEKAESCETGDNQKWMVQGPPTMRWVCLTHVAGNTTPKQRHFWWRQVLGLVSTDPGVEEHSFLCELIETAVARDGINVAALESFETVSRRFQLWEEFYAEALRIAEAGDHGDDLDERRLFLGNHRSKGLAMAMLIMTAHITHLAAITMA